MSGSVVHVTGRLGTPDLTRFKNLIPEAVTRAIYRTKNELENTVFKNQSIVPYLTGRLQDSVVSFVSPGQITFQWSAIDPISNFNYAKIRDEKGGRIGSGDGYYDRLIPKLPITTRKVSLALDGQILPQVPLETHDKYVDIIITEKRIIYKI